jgi:hypothetical protein
VFAAYPRSWFLRAADSPATRAVFDHVASLRRWRQRLASALSWPVARDSVTINVAWKIVDTSLVNVITRAQIEWLRQPLSDGRFAGTGPFKPYPDEARMYADLAATWKAASLQMSRLARANDIAYFHFLQPNQYVTGSKPLSPGERAVAIDEDFVFAHPVRAGYPYLIAAGSELARSGVWFQDLTQRFSDVTEAVYRDHCCHLKQRGNDLLASAIARAIVGRSP